jgi:hypothetical protein
MTTPDESQRARALRRRHKHERQAVIFGVLVAFLAVAGLGAVAVYTGTIEPPFDRDFTAKETKVDAAFSQPCLPEGTTPVGYGDITLNVFNATDRGGLASTVTSQLAERGFVVATTGNSEAKNAGVRIAFGAAGLAQAYTVAAHFPESSFYYDAREDASVDVVLGESYEALTAPEELQLDPAVPMVSAEGCLAITDITPAPLPTEEATEEEPAEEPAAG